MKKYLSALLVLAIVFSLLAIPASAVDPTPSASGSVAEHWFYNQLTAQGQAIYNALLDMFDSGTMEDGTSSYDLAEKGVVSQSAIAAYLNGDRTLFNNFAAAKDAFDLEHPEAWYVDSSYLSFRVTQDSDGYHAYIGPGRSDDYYVYGVSSSAAVKAMTEEVNAAVAAIAEGARGAVSDSGTEDIVKQVRYVHEQITKSISYRDETQCSEKNVGFVRTVYGLVTHQGVCEAYARSMQMVLNELDIPCVLIHGLQTSGTPEQHMWNAVRIGTEWYVVDATWDDPVGLDANGKIKNTGVNGLDGTETETYLLVGQDVTAANWKPSGYVSTGEKEFTYPEIALVSYGSSALERSGLKVTAARSTMGGQVSTVYHVSYNGKGLVESAKDGIYFLVKMYDVNADGSVNSFKDWYYSVHGLHAVQKTFDPNNDFKNSDNEDLGDTDEYMVYNVSNCEYVEFAVTTKAPPNWQSAMDLYNMGGYYSGDYSDILAETGLIYNENGNYEQPPYVKNVSPLFNTPVYVGPTYNIHMEFTDNLYHPDQASIDNAVEGKANDAPQAMAEPVTLYYTGTTYSWGVNARQPHEFANKPVPQNVRWTCANEAHGTHTGTANADGSITMSGINADCELTALDFEFSASRMWADDSVQYEFHLTGLVGRKSNKYIQSGGWSYVFENESAYCAYRCSQGIDWNLWGQPQLLDSDIDLSKMVVEGIDGKRETLDDLRKQMRLDDYDMNGRLMLVVENVNDSGSQAGQLKDILSDQANVDEKAIKGSALYEIDFARICGKTIVETGDSLRMSVGFPAGYNASSGGVVFKVYHFVKNDKGEITKVEEIPVTVTPYGLVFLCDSFSPFAIVALDASQVEATPGVEKTVMILAEEGGSFLRTDEAKTAATGKNGVVALKEGQHVTLKVQPDKGQAISAVTFDGHPISVAGDGTVVIAYEDIQSSSCILSASFISAAVRQADQAKDMASVAADTSKTGSSKVSERLETSPGTAPASSVEVTDDPKPENPFVDVKDDAYYFDAVLWAYENGVTTGTGNGRFNPDGDCTRAQFVTFLWRAANEQEPVSTVNRFSDVSESTHSSYYKAILWAAEQGITTGTGNGNFSPDAVVTRAQAVTFMYRYARKAGIATKTGGKGFNDVTNTGVMTSYYDAIDWAQANGISTGKGSNNFGPMDNCKRKEMITFLYRLFTDTTA